MEERTKRKNAFQVRARASEYPATETQIAVIEAAKYCGIKKGISRAELMDKMHNCIPEYWRLKKEGKLNEQKTD